MQNLKNKALKENIGGNFHELRVNIKQYNITNNKKFFLKNVLHENIELIFIKYTIRGESQVTELVKIFAIHIFN